MARGRAKVKLARIINESKRKATLKKRTSALIKSLETLSLVCKVDACLIVCDGSNDQAANSFTVWPSRQKAETMVSSLTSETENKKKMDTRDKFLERELVRQKDKLEALKKKNDRMEMEETLHKVHSDSSSIVEPMKGKLCHAVFYIEELIKKIEVASCSQDARDVNDS